MLLEVFGARRSLNVIYYTVWGFFSLSQVVQYIFSPQAIKRFPLDSYDSLWYCRYPVCRTYCRLTTDQQAVRTKKQETDPTFWSLYMHFVYCTQWEKIQLEHKFLRAPVGSRHHFWTFISMALLIQFTVGRLSIAYFSSLLEQTFWLHFHWCKILNHINAVSSLQSQQMLPNINTIMSFNVNLKF